MSFYWFDLLIAALLLVFAFFGWRRGLVKELFQTGAWVGGYLAALFFFRPLSGVLKRHIASEILADLAGFLSLFIGSYLLIRLVEYLLREKAGFKMPHSIDGPGGALAGAVKLFILLAAFLMTVQYWPSAYNTLVKRSYFMRWTWYFAHPHGPLGLDVRPPDELKRDLKELKGKVPAMDELKEKIPTVDDLKEGVPSLPETPEVPQEQLPAEEAQPFVHAPSPSSSPKRSSSMTPLAQQPLSPKNGSVPRIKKAEPIKKLRPDVQPADETKQMDTFIRSLD